MPRLTYNWHLDVWQPVTLDDWRELMDIYVNTHRINYNGILAEPLREATPAEQIAELEQMAQGAE